MFGSKLKVAAGVLAGALASGGLAFAAIPGPDGTIAACYQNQSGALRVVDSASHCRSNETALTWNQQGQPGPSGPAGADGVDGQDGAPGLPGADGADGEDGAPGPPGVDGVDGVDGAPGLAGISGARLQHVGGQIPGEFSYLLLGATVVPNGSYLVTATLEMGAPPEDLNMVQCELRDSSTVIARASTGIPMAGAGVDGTAAVDSVTLDLDGPTDVGGEISLWCRGRSQFRVSAGGHMTVLRIGGMF